VTGRWFSPGIPVSFINKPIQQYKNYIILHNVGFQDSRYYICTATNAAGSTIKAIHVVVISRRKLLLLSECMFVFENITVRVRVKTNCYVFKGVVVVVIVP
jgi:hypothetical protein